MGGPSGEMPRFRALWTHIHSYMPKKYYGNYP